MADSDTTPETPADTAAEESEPAVQSAAEATSETRPEQGLEFRDRLLVCADCDRPFLFSASEQDFFFEKDLSEPKRCRHRREERKRDRNARNAPVTSCPMQIDDLAPWTPSD